MMEYTVAIVVLYKLLYLNRQFSEEDMQTVTFYMKRCSISIIVGEMQINTTMRYHLTPVSENVN